MTVCYQYPCSFLAFLHFVHVQVYDAEGHQHLFLFRFKDLRLPDPSVTLDHLAYDPLCYIILFFLIVFGIQNSCMSRSHDLLSFYPLLACIHDRTHSYLHLSNQICHYYLHLWLYGLIPDFLIMLYTNIYFIPPIIMMLGQFQAYCLISSTYILNGLTGCTISRFLHLLFSCLFMNLLRVMLPLSLSDYSYLPIIMLAHSVSLLVYHPTMALPIICSRETTSHISCHPRILIVIIEMILFLPQNQMSDSDSKQLTTVKPRGGPLFDPTSYYYLKSSDYAPLSVNYILQGNTNYYPWCREMTTILITRRKLGFVLGTLQKPSDQNLEELEAWQTCHGVIRQWIWSSVSKDIASQIMYTDDPAVIWADLKDQFMQTNETHLYQLNQDASMTFQGSDSVSTFYTRLKTVWREIDAYGETPKCDCAKCECNINTRIAENQDKTRLRKFLMGLNDNFRQIRSTILSSDKLPKLSKVYQMISHEETQQGLTSHPVNAFMTKGSSSKPPALVPHSEKNTPTFHQASSSQNPTPQHSRKRPPPPAEPIYYKNGRQVNTKYYCFHCSMFGHSDEKCYAQHGLPPGHKYSKTSAAHSSATKTQGTANCALQTSSWTAWDTTPLPPVTRLRRPAPRAKTSNIVETPTVTDPIDLVSDKEENQPESKPELKKKEEEEDTNPIGPYGFPLYSDKYNPKPLPKYNPGIICYASTHHIMNSWIVDSGASEHISGNKLYFSSLFTCVPISIGLPNGNSLTVSLKGTVHINSELCIHDVYYSPDFTVNLISISRLTSCTSLGVSFTNQNAVLYDNQMMREAGRAELVKGLYLLQHAPGHTTPDPIVCTISSRVWHNRLGHTNPTRLNFILQTFNLSFDTAKIHCDTCHLAKQKRLPFPKEGSRSTSVFDMVHMDVWGSFPHATHGDKRYFLTIVDDYSRFTWIFLLTLKSDCYSSFVNFYHMIDTQFGHKIRKIRSDNGGEFTSTNFQSFLQLKGIIHQTSCSHTPQQNGLVERKHQHLLSVARSFHIQANLPIYLWGYSITHAAYVINRLPSEVIGHKSPYEMLHKKPPSYNTLRVFGCLCYAATQSRTHKFSPRATKCVYLGPSPTQKGHTIYSLLTNSVTVNRDVLFYEDMFPLQEASPPNSPGDTRDFPIVNNSPHPQDDDDNHTCDTPQCNTPSETPTRPQDQTTDVTPTSPIQKTTTDLNGAEVPIPDRRETKRPARFDDYFCSFATSTGTSRGTSHPMQNFISYKHLTSSHKGFLDNISKSQEPSSYHQASKDLNWIKAMKEELSAMENNQTWTLVPRPANRKVVGSRWVYRIKHKPSGEIDRFKARLVAKGHTQIEGCDYFETFSPVAKITSVRTLLAVASIKNWNLYHMDVSNAFLHGDLQEDIYMTPPPGLLPPSDTRVCKLSKSIYGLKQANRNWYQKLSAVLLNFNYTQSEVDHTLFFQSTETSYSCLLVYVDDLIITGNDPTAIDALKLHLHRHFNIKDLGKLKYFLGIEVSQSAEGIFISQRKYALDILHEFDQLGAAPSRIPMSHNSQPCQGRDPPLNNPEKFRRLIGKLLYLTVTRPDISFSVAYLSQFLSTPLQSHFQSGLKILKYIKQAPGNGLLYKRNASLQLHTFCDADWADCPTTRRSVSGYCILLGSTAISWKSKKQNTVSRSSAESEYRAMSSCVCELLWIHFLLHDLRVTLTGKSTLSCDNIAAIHIASNPVFHERTKHIEIDCHFIRQHLKAGLFELHHVPSHSQLADILTKPASTKALQSFLPKLGMFNLHSPA